MKKLKPLSKALCLALFSFSSLEASSLGQIYQWYKDSNYKQVCSIPPGDYNRFSNDENFINIYADSCLRTDMINKLAIPIIQLRKTKESRANALYYTTILYQKKILYHAIIDGLESIPKDLPSTDYILSQIYDLYALGKYTKQNDQYIFNINSQTYNLYIQKDNDGFDKIVLESVQDGQVKEIRKYW